MFLIRQENFPDGLYISMNVIKSASAIPICWVVERKSFRLAKIMLPSSEGWFGEIEDYYSTAKCNNCCTSLHFKIAALRERKGRKGQKGILHSVPMENLSFNLLLSRRFLRVAHEVNALQNTPQPSFDSQKEICRQGNGLR